MNRPVERRGDVYPEPAERYQSFDNRPLAPQRPPPKKAAEKKAATVAAAAKLKPAPYDTDFGFERPERFESRPLPPQPAPLNVEPERFLAPAPPPAEPKKQKKVTERNAQASNDDI